jgi:hypothetical protein
MFFFKLKAQRHSFIITNNNQLKPVAQPSSSSHQLIQHLPSQHGINNNGSSNSNAAASTSHSFMISSQTPSANEFQRQHQQHSQSPFTRISNPNHLISNNNNFTAQQISSPICSASTGLSVISLGGASQPQSTNHSSIPTSQSFLNQNFLQSKQQQNVTYGLDALSISSPSSSPHPSQQAQSGAVVNRASFLSRQNPESSSSSSSSSSQSTNRKPEELDAVANELLSEFVVKKSNGSLNKNEETPAPISLSPLSSSSSSSTHSSRSSSSSGDENNDNNDVIEDLLDDEDEVHAKNDNKVSVSNKSGTLIIRRDANNSNDSQGQPLPSKQVNARINQLKSTDSHQQQLYDVSNSSSFANITDEHQIVNTVGLGVGSGFGLGGAIVQPSNNNESQLRKNVNKKAH